MPFEAAAVPFATNRTKETWVRLAAFIDGEGCIRAKFRESGIAHPYLHITNTDARLMTWLLESFGGCVTENRPKNSKWRIRYDWEPKRSTLHELLTECLPFLLLKREQAEVALAMLSFVRRRGRTKISREEQFQRQTLKSRLHVLNAKGVSHAL